MSNFNVKISYKNKNLEKVKDRTYDFGEYTDMIYFELMRVIMDIEDAFYRFEDSNSKEEWSTESTTNFQKIRHKILDQANAIKRLPENVFFKDVPLSDAIVDLLDR